MRVNLRFMYDFVGLACIGIEVNEGRYKMLGLAIRA